MPKSKTVTVKLTFGEGRHILWHTATDNFISEQPGRFEFIEGKKCLTGTMFFCSSYLEAVFVKALEGGVAIYADTMGDPDDFVVVTKKKLTPTASR